MRIRQTIKKAVALGTGALMLGATLLGASAANLSDYPGLFLDDGKVTAKLVVGEKAATIDVVGGIDIAADLQAAAVSKESVTVTGTGITVTGGKTKEVNLGALLSTEFTSALTDSGVSSLKDEKVSWNDKDIDVEEKLDVGDMQIFLTEKDKDFSGNPYLGTPTTNGIKYTYIISDSDLDVSKIGEGTDEDVLKVEILGKSLEITGVTSSSTTDEVTLKVADEYYLNIGDSVEVEGKTIKLVNVGSTSVVVDVDGVIETIAEAGGAEKVNGINVDVENLFYVDEKVDRAATLKAGNKITDTVKSGDPMELFGEPSRTADAEWVWYIVADPATSNTSMTIGAYFNQNYDTDTEPVKGIGEAFTLPNDYASVYMDGLTASADADVAFEFFDSVRVVKYENNTDVPSTVTTLDDQKALSISSADEIFKVNVSGTITDTDTVYIVATDGGDKMVAFENSDGDIQLATPAAPSASENFSVDYESTELTIDYEFNSSVSDNVTISGELSIATTDTIILDADIANGYFGNDDTGYESTDYATTFSGVNKENDYLTDWGVIIKEPETAFDNEEFVLSLPPEQVKVNVVVVGQGGAVEGSAGTVTTDKVNPVGVDFGVLDSDAPVAGTTNLIVVGGPCVNTEAARLMGNPANCAEGFAEGEAKLALFDDDGKVALLVAGYSGQDTLGAVRALLTEDLPAKSDAKVITTNYKTPSVE